jgi:hypothetical protein
MRREETVMKIFVAGARDVLGRDLGPQLVTRGHEVVGIVFALDAAIVPANAERGGSSSR